MIFLTGAPASGKTTLGRRLATALGVSFVDLDAEIVRSTGRTIPDVFASDGEAAFRDLETQTLARLGDVGVIALGGGTLLRAENRRLCEARGTIFCLDTPSDAELARRLGAAAGTRPLGDRAKERAAHYASFPSRVSAWFDLDDSLVLCGKGLARMFLAARPVVADATVSSIWSERLGLAPIATIPSGETHKTIGTVSALWGAFARAGLGRKDVVAALGGGVTGDLTGFAAATWMRGIDWINVPTTLLAMVDASTGGKTGCDLPEGKNLAGAFHAPRLVVIDSDFLSTLPPDRLRDGQAEMIKHTIISVGTGPEGYSGNVPTSREIAQNLAVKVEIVRADPFERLGRRILLNCGHTVGHAVEKATNYAVSHGAAVAIGCVEEAWIAARRGLSPSGWPETLAARFAAAGLPTALPEGLSLASLVPLMKGDKKRAGSVVTFALPCGWGDVRAVPIDLAKEAL